MIAVQSWDFVDVLVAYKHGTEDKTFEIIEETFPFKNFKNLRIKAQSQNSLSLDDIYERFQTLTNIDLSLLEKLKAYEIQIQAQQLFAIQENIQKLNDGDIVVNTSVYDEAVISYFLKRLHIEKKLKIISYQNLNDFLNEPLHHTGILNNPKYSTFTPYISAILTLDEKKDLKRTGNKDLVYLQRALRLSCPYEKESIEAYFWNEQGLKNIPLLLLCSKAIFHAYERNELENVLFVTRDCCHLKKIFHSLYPEVPINTFHTSRMVFNFPNKYFVDYVKSIWNKNSLIVDIRGTGKSATQFFEQHLNSTPHLFILSSRKRAENIYPFFNKKHLNFGDLIEIFNYDRVGTLIDYAKEGPIRAEPEYDLKFISIMHSCVDYYLKNFSKDYKIEANLEEIEYFAKKIKSSKKIKTFFQHEPNHERLYKRLDGKTIKIQT